jgi:hypothetical protein
MIKKLLIITLLFTSSIYAAGDKGTFGLNINSDDLEVEGRVSLATRTRTLEYRNFYLDANFINGEDDNLYGVGFYVENSPHGYSNLTFDIGLRSIFSGNDATDETFVAIPIYVAAKARMYLGNLPKSALGFKLSYAPNPLSFSDAKSYLEYRIEVDMQLIDNINVYAGYRNIDTEYDSDDVNFNSAGYAGFKFVF